MAICYSVHSDTCTQQPRQYRGDPERFQNFFSALICSFGWSFYLPFFCFSTNIIHENAEVEKTYGLTLGRGDNQAPQIPGRNSNCFPTGPPEVRGSSTRGGGAGDAFLEKRPTMGPLEAPGVGVKVKRAFPRPVLRSRASWARKQAQTLIHGHCGKGGSFGPMRLLCGWGPDGRGWTAGAGQ